MRAILLVSGLAAALGGCDRKKAAEPQPAEAPRPAEARVDLSHKGQLAPAVPFLRPDGGPATLAGFRGKPVMVNLWATWCAPCIREMPTLDALARDRARDFALVAVSQDIAGRRAVEPFFAKARFVALKPFIDKENVLMTALGLDTLPVTILYGADGREKWRVVGSMDWTGPRAKALIDEAL